MSGWKKRAAVLAAIVTGLLGLSADVSSAALAKASGGSGYSGKLSANPTIRRQQLICDPATPAASAPGNSGGAPISGSTSVTYDPSIVTLSRLAFGPNYFGSALVEVAVSRPAADVAPAFSETTLEPLDQFLLRPLGPETGYVQVTYALDGPAGQMSPPPNFTTVDSDGVKGFDTHALMFSYVPGVADTAVAKYTIYADPGGDHSGNKADSLTGMNPDGSTFTLGPGQLSPATVSGSLVVATVPLPPAVWTGLVMLATVMVGVAARKAVRA